MWLFYDYVKFYISKWEILRLQDDIFANGNEDLLGKFWNTSVYSLIKCMEYIEWNIKEPYKTEEYVLNHFL